MHTEFELAVND